MTCDTIIVGGGAAGFMAAIFAAAGGGDVRLIERTSDGGRKILISGGGRCNVMPSRFDPSQYFTTSSRNILRNILRSWPDTAQRAFFENDLGIALALEKETGKLFPVSNRARDVRDTLVRKARAAGATMMFDATVRDVVRSHDVWIVRMSDGDELRTRNVIIATGGLSVPKTGSDGIGLRIARALGYTVHETYPALTPLTLNPPRFGDLAGVSLEVQLTAHAARTRDALVANGGFLFTHNGYSGPSVLDVSHTAVQALEHGTHRKITVQWTAFDAAAWDAALREGNAAIGTVLRRHLPDRLATRLAAHADVPQDRVVSQLRREERTRLVAALTSFELPYNGHEGYRKAEVTGGGVALDEIDARTMQSRLHAGLFFCGEVLDAFGPIGGYNFAWAWATGRLAGMAAAR